MRTGLGFILLSWVALETSCCPPYCAGRCTGVPPTDGTPPTATLTIEFWDENGQPQLLQISTDTTIEVAEEERFNIVYGGTDDVGIRTLVLDFHWTQWAGSTPQRVSPLISPRTFDTACSPRSDATRFRWEDRPKSYGFQAFATDFHGNRGSSPKLTVVHGTPPGPIVIP